ncbi:MAG: DinB family protein [Thermoanaerobaculia bacterium]
MSNDRRTHALREARAEMIAVRQRILDAAEGRSNELLLTAPAGGGWSGAEVLDHIRTAESQLVKALGKVERGETVRIPKRAWYYRLPMAPAFWPIRIPAPRLVRPRPRAELRPREVLESLATSRAELFALADRMGEEKFSRLVFPHFLLGRFTGLTWFRFISRHERKHLGQLERTLAQVSAA